MAKQRSTEEVLKSHLQHRQKGDLEADLAENYAPDAIILTMEGEFRGAEGLRKNATELRGYFGNARFLFPVKRISGRFAFLEWRAEGGKSETIDGSDTFVIEDGRIVCQTIRYTVGHRQDAGADRSSATSEEADETPPAARVVRRSGADGRTRYAVEFIEDSGQSVTVECLPPEAGDEAGQEAAIEAARSLLRSVLGDEGSRKETKAAEVRSLRQPANSDEAANVSQRED